MRWVALVALVALAGCKRSRPEPAVTEPPKQAPADREALRAVKVEDAFGYLTGKYHTSSNNPALYADPERKLYVVLGKRGRTEFPLAEPAIAAYEDLLLDSGYHVNGKTPADHHQKVMIDGKEMVVMSTAEIFPEMPADLKSHFTANQLEILYHTTGTAGVALYSGHDKDYPSHPAMWAYSGSIEVIGPDIVKDFPVEQASEAFAEYRALVKRSKLP